MSLAPRFGVEIEHFLFDGERLARRYHTQAALQVLCSEGAIATDYDAAGCPTSVVLPAHGSTVVKPDYAAHILEIAFPPCTSPSIFHTLYDRVVCYLQRVIEDTGLRLRKDTAVLPEVPRTFDLFPHTAGGKTRLEELRNRRLPATALAALDFSACLCATQVHVPIRDRYFEVLPELYATEYLVPLLFARGTRFRTRRCHAVRPVILRDNWSDYPAVAIPDPIPSSKAAYETMLAMSRPFVRDYCFIAPSKHRTLEFRSADALDNASTILELVVFRLAQCRLAVDERVPTTEHDAAMLFWQACTSGTAPASRVRRDRRRLAGALGKLPPAWAGSSERLMQRLDGFVSHMVDDEATPPKTPPPHSARRSPLPSRPGGAA